MNDENSWISEGGSMANGFTGGIEQDWGFGEGVMGVSDGYLD